MPELTVSASFVRALIDVAVGRGAPRAALIAEAGIDPADLDDRENRIPFDRYVALMRVGQKMTGDPALALHFGESVDVREVSISALVSHALSTPMDAFVQVNRYARLDVEVEAEDRPRFALERRQGRFWLVDTRPNPNAFPEMTESTFARMASSTRRLGIPWPLQEIHVTHDAPFYRDEYARIFGVPVQFGSEWNAIAFDEAAMSKAVGLQQPYLFEILSRRADGLLERLNRSRTMRGRVEAAVTPLLPGGKARIGTVAARLGVSRQTLYRRLREEGATFEEVLDALRRTLAIEALKGGRESVGEIAYALGFADRGAFSRAFKRWTGSTPAAWRAAARAE